MSEKRRFRVSELLRCDLFAPTPFADDAMARGSLMHAVVASSMLSRFPHLQVEPRIEVDRGFYVLVGHPDLVDKEARIVYEVKPRRLRPSYSLQLEAYAEMLEELEGGEWSAAFVLYERDGSYAIQPTFRKKGALRTLDDLARARLLLEKAGKRLLVREMCGFCARKSRCDLIRLGLSVLAV
jgi:hypothetical protein